MSIIGTVYEDVTADVLGKVGAWQWLVVLLCSMLTLPSLFHGYEDMLLLTHSGEVTCIPPERYEVYNNSLCTVVSIGNDTNQMKCNRWQAKLLWLIWLKKSWLVFCENKIKHLSATMIYRMGLTFGCVMFGVIADSVGRRTALMVEVFAQLFLGSILTFCDSLAWFQLLVFLKSLFGGANFFVGIILACEVASNEWRSRFNTIVSSSRLTAIICMVPLANSVPNLETLSCIATLYTFLLVIILRLLPESPQWLLYNRKIFVAEKILYHAAKKNGQKLCSQFKIRPVNHRVRLLTIR
ncbi:unnamed protein product [Chilo suppressalis]|uniref:Major facilitator superfamily (MFS) profile domain-containing protein n=1 Tax=Chilo suppressalis TaxID=168631 RepID=A0ABN8B2R7_CHISP|nr:hypothetical protein evm_010512 [Chilo suppressalis]CAH0399844.1 unnamed protein product [Chilo suppressalis]